MAAPHASKVVRGRLIEVRRRRSFVEAIVYPGPKAEGEPVAEWEFPISFRYDLQLAIDTADRQTKLEEPKASE